MDATVGFASGAGGTLISTRDGGAIWSLRPSGTQFDLYGLYFADKEAGYAVGQGSSLLKTLDGGKSWARQNGSDTTIESTVFALHFPDGRTGWALGEYGSILRYAE